MVLRVVVLLSLVLTVSLAWLESSNDSSGGERPQATDRYNSIEGGVFHTHYKIIYKKGSELDFSKGQLQAEIEKRLGNLNKVASGWDRASEVSCYNMGNREFEFEVSAELRSLLEMAEYYRVLTQGAFDAGYQDGKVDLSGLAKGYAVDQVCEFLEKELGFEHFLVQIGGEAKARGVNERGRAWTAVIHKPFDASGMAWPTVSLTNTSIATSGQYFKKGHLKDSLSKLPIKNTLYSCSVIHPSNAAADALATALFVMGEKTGKEWADRNKVKAVFITKNGKVVYSAAINEKK